MPEMRTVLNKFKNNFPQAIELTQEAKLTLINKKRINERRFKIKLNNFKTFIKVI